MSKDLPLISGFGWRSIFNAAIKPSFSLRALASELLASSFSANCLWFRTPHQVPHD
jgi:hypothetical protein